LQTGQDHLSSGYFIRPCAQFLLCTEYAKSRPAGFNLSPHRLLTASEYKPHACLKHAISFFGARFIHIRIVDRQAKTDFVIGSKCGYIREKMIQLFMIVYICNFHDVINDILFMS
jgi:hypothetical protein